MKMHPIAQVLNDKDLELKESLKAVWTGGLTGAVSYTLLNSDGTALATEQFRFNRNPGMYRKLGATARAGTARHAALDKLLTAALAA